MELSISIENNYEQDYHTPFYCHCTYNSNCNGDTISNIIYNDYRNKCDMENYHAKSNDNYDNNDFYKKQLFLERQNLFNFE